MRGGFFSLYYGGALMDRPEPIADRLQGYRDYLQCLARVQLDAGLQAKIDLSGVVQETLLVAQQSWDQLAGRSAGEQAAWLRSALAHNLADELRKLQAQKRGGLWERSLQQALDDSSARLEAWVGAEPSPPSEKVIHP